MKTNNYYELGISMKALVIAILIIVTLAGITIGAAIKNSTDTVKRVEPKVQNTVIVR